ncbi:hypothetical protein FPCIR_13325 [Fusarium pseudocircinatum]|uniref:Uncharacterized protein n=1 Tax=Fusarium pseudocircinatum TaxID=56676 RepID=A0A8H5KKW1_9HYPO|nr:hypothetical protein FPCIR_13325 [Fusarium pseudocircinatum]
MVARGMTLRQSHSLAPSLPGPLVEVELSLIRHFELVQFPAFLLPGVSADLFDECKHRYLVMASRSHDVSKSIIACCASNKSSLTQDTRFAQLGLRYYADVITSINGALSEIAMGARESDDFLLVTVIFAYLYELWSPGQAHHAADHVNGAIQLFKMRHKVDGPRWISTEEQLRSATSPMDRLIAESILYQSLMLSLRNPFTPTYRTNPDFFAWTEILLQDWWAGNTFEDQNTAVLGLPPQLYHIILETVDFCSSAKQSNTELVRLYREMRVCEDCVLRLRTEGALLQIHNEPLLLYVLAASLLLDWVSEASKRSPLTSLYSVVPPTQAAPRWQVTKALLVLRSHLSNEKWSMCFLGSWPMLILGYGVQSHGDIRTVKEVLSRMWRTTGYGEVQRISEELDQLWSQR